MAEKSTIYVFYGSQTGNAEGIAKDLYGRLEECGIVSQCDCLNTAKKLDIKNSALAMIIVCSTTGNGDCPDNGDQWWRSVKLRSAEKDMFASVPFAVLGLGDTNYDKFCFMGKCIDKRLGELGGKRLADLCCADEATGLEETVEKWKDDIIETVKSINKLS